MSDSGKRKTIVVHDASLDISMSPILSLCQSGNLAVDSLEDEVHVDFSKTGFASISQAAAIAQILKDRKARGLRSSLSHPRPDAKQYMERMNFYRILGSQEEESFSRHDPADRFIPMASLEDESSPSALSDKLRGMVQKHAPDVHESILGSLHMAFGEIMDNAIQHSATPTPGIAAAQYYPSRQYIELCVVDGGKGVVASLRENPAYSAYGDDELAALAYQSKVGQYVGRPDYANNRVSMGKGLYIASRIVCAMGGVLWMASRSAFTKVSESGTATLSDCFYPGTLVVARLLVRPGMVIKGSDISENFASSPMSWSAAEGGFYYTDGNEDDILW